MAKKEVKNQKAKKRRTHIELEAPEEDFHNEYYRRVSTGYKTVKFLSVGILLVYLAVMMCIYRAEITYDNLMYLLKDMDTDVSVSTSGFENISFPDNGDVSGDIFKNRLVLVDNSMVTFYNTAGAEELDDKTGMEEPHVITGDKYTLVYDIGGNDYRMYTTITKVLDKSTEYELQGAALSDSGAFSLVTRSRENRYLVTVFNENFKEVTKIYKDKYVMDVALDSDGTHYAIASSDMRNSEFVCEVMIGKVRSEESFTTEIEGVLPLSVEALDSGNFALICDTAVYFFSDSGEKIGEYKLQGMSLSFADVSGNHVMVSGNENLVGTTGRVILIDGSGTEIYNRTLSGKIRDIALGEESMFVLFEESLSKIAFDGTAESVEWTESVCELVPYADNVVVCSNRGAKMGFAIEE